MNPRPPDSTGKLDTAETNPLPHVSSARAWTAIEARPIVSLPKSAPVIREKVAGPRRVRADGTEEICVEDIMVIVPRPTPPRPKQPSSEALDDADIIVEHVEPVRGPELFRPPPPEAFRPPSFSVHVTQEILVDDVLEVAEQIPQPERRSTVPPPWTVDVSANVVDDLDFPTPPQYSGPYPAAVGPRITNFSATQVYRRRSANLKIVVASVSVAAAVVMIAGLARLAPTAGSTDGPVGIAIHAPKKLDKTVRGRVLAYGNARQLVQGEAISIDALPTVRKHR